MDSVYRPARPDDAKCLFDIRRRSILELASEGIPGAEAAEWAQRLAQAGMAQKLRELEIWIAELEGVPAGWGAILGGSLEGLYAAPQFARRGVASGLLGWLERLMAGRGIQEIRADASSNARDFYLKRGYRLTGPQAADRSWPIVKPLQ